jgi:hypothetical protein
VKYGVVRRATFPVFPALQDVMSVVNQYVNGAGSKNAQVVGKTFVSHVLHDAPGVFLSNAPAILAMIISLLKNDA